MTEHVAGIQHSVLKWAREQAGLSPQDVADAMNRDVGIIEAWESGQDAPTYVQLEKLAYQLYKRPVAIFFFPAPPPETNLKNFFRTLPDFEVEAMSADTRYALRYGKSMQLALAELNEGINPAERKLFTQIKLTPKINISKTVFQIRHLLGINLGDQTRWGSSDEALKAWREQIEELGKTLYSG